MACSSWISGGQSTLGAQVRAAPSGPGTSDESRQQLSASGRFLGGDSDCLQGTPGSLAGSRPLRCSRQASATVLCQKYCFRLSTVRATSRLTGSVAESAHAPPPSPPPFQLAQPAHCPFASVTVPFLPAPAAGAHLTLSQQLARTNLPNQQPPCPVRCLRDFTLSTPPPHPLPTTTRRPKTTQNRQRRRPLVLILAKSTLAAIPHLPIPFFRSQSRIPRLHDDHHCWDVIFALRRLGRACAISLEPDEKNPALASISPARRRP